MKNPRADANYRGLVAAIVMSLAGNIEECRLHTLHTRNHPAVASAQSIYTRPCISASCAIYLSLVILLLSFTFGLQIITANPWSMIALLCGVFLVLFKAADFAKLSIKWMIKIRKRHLKKRARELNHIS